MGDRPWNRNIQYYDLVLDVLPAGVRRVLEVGSGEGILANALAERSVEVVAVDVSPLTVARARAMYVRPNLTFLEADVMTTTALEKESFDVVVAVATLHHLPLEAGLRRLRELVRPGGTLVVVGLYQLRTMSDFFWAGIAVAVSWWRRLTRRYHAIEAPVREPKETLEEIEAAVEKILPHAAFTRELLFRYSLIWKKP